MSQIFHYISVITHCAQRRWEKSNSRQAKIGKPNPNIVFFLLQCVYILERILAKTLSFSFWWVLIYKRMFFLFVNVIGKNNMQRIYSYFLIDCSLLQAWSLKFFISRSFLYYKFSLSLNWSLKGTLTCQRKLE